MFLLKWLFQFLKNIFKNTARAIVLSGYNEQTICRYFRKRGARIGQGCSIATKSLGTPYLVSLGNHVWISPGVVFHSHDGGTWVLRDKYPYIDVFGPIVIEDNCLIGANVQLLPNIRIGKNSIVAAGSVVVSDIPPNSIVMGVPARPISSFSKYEERSVAQWKEQIPPGIDTSVKNWRRSKRDYKKKLRKHLTAIYLTQPKTEEKNSKE
jgi:acetyltransferase-like isoleucine patch superfamily enzyme